MTLSDEAVRELYERLRPYPSESDVSECLKELLALRAEVAGLKHDLDRSMANHVADVNALEPGGEPDEPVEYGIEDAMRIAGLWRAGKMIGGDEDGVRDALLAEVERLQALNRQAEPPGSAWQPIDTAPRDGTQILTANEDTISVGYYHTHTHKWRDDGDMGWGGMLDVEPTHWKPLPALPENRQAEPEAGRSVFPALGAGSIPFTHWSKDPLVPYTGCNCSSCEDARQPVDVSASDSTVPNRGEKP